LFAHLRCGGVASVVMRPYRRAAHACAARQTRGDELAAAPVSAEPLATLAGGARGGVLAQLGISFFISFLSRWLALKLSILYRHALFFSAGDTVSRSVLGRAWAGVSRRTLPSSVALYAPHWRRSVAGGRRIVWRFSLGVPGDRLAVATLCGR